MKVMTATVFGGLVAGALDIVFAFVFYGLTLHITPMQVLQSVAAGAVGREAARGGGWETAALGGVFHFFIATMMAAAFVIASRFILLLLRNPWISGILYGLFLWVVMTFVVVPLSAIGPRPAPEGLQLAGALFTHVFFVGVPIALVAKRFA